MKCKSKTRNQKRTTAIVTAKAEARAKVEARVKAQARVTVGTNAKNKGRLNLSLPSKFHLHPSNKIIKKVMCLKIIQLLTSEVVSTVITMTTATVKAMTAI